MSIESTAPPRVGESTSTLPEFEPVASSPPPEPLEPEPAPQPAPPTPDPPAPPIDDEITTADDWAAAGHHKVWTPSGKRILIRIPDLFTLIQEDAIPEHLRGVALSEIETGSPTGAAQADTGNGPTLNWDVVKQAAELYEHVSFHMVIRPEITLEQFRRFPAEDRDMLREIAMRQRATDARGVRLGVEPLDRWERFRHWHQCPEGCEACEAAQADLSSLGGR